MPTRQVAYYEMDTFHTTCVLLPYPSLTRDQCYTSSLSLMSLIPSSPLAITSPPTGGQHPHRGTAILPPTGGWGQPFPPPPQKRQAHPTHPAPPACSGGGTDPVRSRWPYGQQVPKDSGTGSSDPTGFNGRGRACAGRAPGSRPREAP